MEYQAYWWAYLVSNFPSFDWFSLPLNAKPVPPVCNLASWRWLLLWRWSLDGHWIEDSDSKPVTEVCLGPCTSVDKRSLMMFIAPRPPHSIPVRESVIKVGWSSPGRLHGWCIVRDGWSAVGEKMPLTANQTPHQLKMHSYLSESPSSGGFHLLALSQELFTYPPIGNHFFRFDSFQRHSVTHSSFSKLLQHHQCNSCNQSFVVFTR